MRTALILAFVISTSTSGELCLTRASKGIGEVHRFSPRAILEFLMNTLGQGWLWMAIAFLAASFYGFLTMLSWYPVSFVVPATSLSYVVGAFGAKFILHERVKPQRWIGISLICVGVALSWRANSPISLNVVVIERALRYVAFACAAVPLIFYLLSAWAAWCFFRGMRKRALTKPPFAPPVSILKPVRGLDRDAYENFASFCRQDYPDYEILFAAGDENDAAIPVIHRIIRDFPERSIRLLVGVEQSGANDKVAKLCRLVKAARNDLLVIADSDVRVAPDYLRGVAGKFADARVGAVTALYRAIEAPSFGAVMDAVGSSGSFAGSVLVARSLEGLKFAMGSTMATTRRRLDEIGGFPALLDLHSDDYEFGKRIAENGYRVELAPEPVDMVFPSETFGGYLRHELRWLIGIRHIRRSGHFGLLMTQGLAWAVLAAALSPSAALAAAWLGIYVALRLGTSYVVGVWGLRDPVLRRRLWLVPLHDLFVFFLWIASFAMNRIEWRGLRFTLENGRMVPVSSRSDNR